jgi:hypothetical protein
MKMSIRSAQFTNHPHLLIAPESFPQAKAHYISQRAKRLPSPEGLPSLKLSRKQASCRQAWRIAKKFFKNFQYLKKRNCWHILLFSLPFINIKAPSF